MLRIRHVIGFISLVLVTGGTGLFAEPAEFPAHVRSIRLIKLPLQPVHVRWSAVVRIEGGQFVVGERRDDRFVPLATTGADPGQQTYRVDIEPSPVASLYELHYRDRQGRDLVLGALLADCQVIEQGAQRVAASPPPAGAAAAGASAPGLRVPSSTASCLDLADAWWAGERPAPESPPPKAV
jgi:hypothetical protein